jgi:accessory colonization factor AcfC
MKHRTIAFAMLALVTGSARGEEAILAYGPGGPAPAMKEAAEVFSKARGARVEVAAGPTDTWIAKARQDADVIFSGAEYMMTDFVPPRSWFGPAIRRRSQTSPTWPGQG